MTYEEYITENLTSITDYSEYISENLNIEYAEYVSLSSSICNNTYYEYAKEYQLKKLKKDRIKKLNKLTKIAQNEHK